MVTRDGITEEIREFREELRRQNVGETISLPIEFAREMGLDRTLEPIVADEISGTYVYTDKQNDRYFRIEQVDRNLEIKRISRREADEELDKTMLRL